MLAQVLLEYEPEHSAEKDDWTVDPCFSSRDFQA